MTRLTILLAVPALLVACEQQSTTVAGVQGTEATRTCSRAYGSTQAKIEKIMKENGITEMPPMPSKEDFVAACEKLPIEAAKCLDPVRQAADPAGCKAELDKIPADQRQEIEGIFQAAQEPPEAEEPAEGEAAEGEAAEGEAAPAK